MSSRLPPMILIAATLLVLLPFVSKPFHIDDPMYLWSAQHIREHPLDFYGFEVNWYGGAQPMAVVNMNPPGGSFWLAGVSLLAGWNESGLHLGMLAPAVAAILGTWRLARRLAAPPLLSALALLSLPGFLVSATTLMPDVLAAALWCWAIVLWMEGLASNRIRYFAGAALLAALCVLTKYVGLGLVPLFLAHGAFVRRRPGIWLAVPIVVVLIAFTYRSYVHSLYGVDPFVLASGFSLKARAGSGTFVSHTLVGLAFLGGTASTVAFLSPWLWSWRQIAGFACGALIVVVYPLLTAQGARWWLIAHLVVFVCLGLQIAGLAVRRIGRAPDSGGVLLACWIGGIFVFGAFANWTTSARSFEAALPAIAILSAAEARRAAATQTAERRLFVPLALGTALALLVAQGDYALAHTSRVAAEDLASVAHGWPGPMRFEGAWGFQQYMESRGVRKLDLQNETMLVPGTLLVLPPFGSNTPSPDPTTVRVVGRRRFPVSSVVSSVSPALGAGFYSDVTGPVPYVFGRSPAEEYVLLEVAQPIRLHYVEPSPGG